MPEGFVLEIFIVQVLTILVLLILIIWLLMNTKSIKKEKRISEFALVALKDNEKSIKFYKQMDGRFIMENNYWYRELT